MITTNNGYTVTNTNNTIFCKAAGGVSTLTVAYTSGRLVYTIWKTDCSVYVLTFSARIFASETTSDMTLNYNKTIRIQSNGFNC